MKEKEKQDIIPEIEKILVEYCKDHPLYVKS
jgi:hypothetical protein